MQYVDSIEQLQLNLWNNRLKKKEVITLCDQIISKLQNTVDIIQDAIVDSKAKIQEWKNRQLLEPGADYQKRIEVFSTIAEYYDLNGRLTLLELDVETAYKYIFVAKTEYEYRFFARRLYTLMHVAEEGLVKPTGTLLPKLEKIVDIRYLESYKNCHSALSKFISNNDKELKTVRNSNEAHKKDKFEIQLGTIENISVAKSIQLIQEFTVLIYNLNASFLIMHGALSASLNKIC